MAAYTQKIQEEIIPEENKFYVPSMLYTVAKGGGMGNRINTILQTYFFLSSNICASKKGKIKDAVLQNLFQRGEAVKFKNYGAIDMVNPGLYEIDWHSIPEGEKHLWQPCNTGALNL